MSASTREGEASARQAFAAVVAVEMRTPLARVELAASQLIRDAVTPTAREQAGRVSDAVEDLDELISKIVGLLVPATTAGTATSALQPLLESLRDRLAPVLEVQGIRWDVPPRCESELLGDARCVRRAALGLLRAVGEGAPPGSVIVLRMEPGSGDAGIVLDLRLPDEAGHAAITPSLLASLRTVALRQHARFEESTDGVSLAFTLWMPPTASLASQRSG